MVAQARRCWLNIPSLGQFSCECLAPYSTYGRRKRAPPEPDAQARTLTPNRALAMSGCLASGVSLACSCSKPSDKLPPEHIDAAGLPGDVVEEPEPGRIDAAEVQEAGLLMVGSSFRAHVQGMPGP